MPRESSANGALGRLKSDAPPGAPVSNRPLPSVDVRPPSGQLQTGAPRTDVRPPTGRIQSGAPVADALPPTGRSKTGAPRASKPPHNPGLRQLIAGKRAWSDPLDADAVGRGFLGWHARGHVPHFDAPGVLQFVTFRLDDALPAGRRAEWEALLRIEDDRERRKQLEGYLDRGFGECWLRRPGIAGLVADALRFFDGQRYRLESWVVMPNHVHLVVEVWQTPLVQLLHSWKRHTAVAANRLLGRSGRFWQREYWDTLVRDEEHSGRARRYVEDNPLKAKFVRDLAEWPWSSAHGRALEGRPV